MYNIGLIEDNDEQRVELYENIELTLEDDLNINDIKVIAIAPYKDYESYISWIHENDISVIVTDEKLYEIGAEYGNGHELVKFLKPFFPGLKFFILTSYPDDIDLSESYANNFFVIDKVKFNNPNEASFKINHLHLIVSSAKDFKNDFLNDLKSLKKLAEKIALGDASESEIQTAKSLQEKIELPISSYDHFNRKLWITEFEQELEKFKELENNINDFLKNEKE